MRQAESYIQEYISTCKNPTTTLIKEIQKQLDTSIFATGSIEVEIPLKVNIKFVKKYLKNNGFKVKLLGNNRYKNFKISL